MMSKSQRTKGAAGEREAANILRRVFPDARRRVVNHAGVEDGRDLESTGAFAVQVKRHKRPSPISAINEIKADGTPLLLTRGDHGIWYAVMPLDSLLDILEDVGVAYD